MTDTPSPTASAWDLLLSTSAVQRGIVCLLAVTLMFSKIGTTGLAAADDAFYAQKAKEMLATGDWMTMHYNGTPAFENPPFFIWLVAGSISVFGVTEYAAKFPSALMGVATVLLLFSMGRRLFGPWTGFFAAAVLATTNIFTRYASRGMMDVTLSFFVLLALYSFMLALDGDRRWFLLWGLGIAVSILIKSVLGFFPGVITVLFILVRRRWDVLASPWLYAGAVVAFGLGCSWYLANYFRFGDAFLQIHFGWLILHRGLVEPNDSWTGHLSYVKDLFSYYWPWLPVFVWGYGRMAARMLREDAAALVILWVTTIFVVMSAMQTRVLWYIMPVFPGAALLCGDALASVLSGRRRILAARFWLGLTVFAAILINATPLKLSRVRETDTRLLAPYVRFFGEKGIRSVNFRNDHYWLNNVLLFYSDHPAVPRLDRLDDLRRTFAGSDTVLAVVRTADLAEMRSSGFPFHLIRSSDQLTLIANAPLEAASVRALE